VVIGIPALVLLRHSGRIRDYEFILYQIKINFVF
jgi:hypothetical protein